MQGLSLDSSLVICYISIRREAIKMSIFKLITKLTDQEALKHLGHEITIVRYGDQNISLECETCSEVLQDWDSSQ